MRVANWMLLPFLAACGGTAVVDGEPGVGGGANTTTTGPTTTTSSSNMCVRTNDSFEMVLRPTNTGTSAALSVPARWTVRCWCRGWCSKLALAT